MSEDQPPEGMQYVPLLSWETLPGPRRRTEPLNGHLGYFAYHEDDCRCPIAGWPCNRAGYVWSCCGSFERYDTCTLAPGGATGA